ncbi:MAG: hypothetical protein KKH84_09340 [Proteobacteria bacterium]|nr:hypothetical protein [Pseudomonadota bacterium]MBU4421189.1 hypothetical protein [Pseudomonadota bacterium]MCG2829756.1 hypothetical protein [Desulfobacteraceae bacterium]
MKLERVKMVFCLFSLLFLVMALNSAPALGACGEMHIEAVEQTAGAYQVDVLGPQIIDAWTTNDPFGNPYVRANDFTIGSDILAFVTLYHHIGGFIPLQYIRAYTCDIEEDVLKTCRYDWTVGPLPEGIYLLINYYNPVEFPAHIFDWAVKVGDLIFGYPDQAAVPPGCVTLHE